LFLPKWNIDTLVLPIRFHVAVQIMMELAGRGGRTAKATRAVVIATLALLGVGCTAKQSMPPPVKADFNVLPAPDGNRVVWWLRLSGPDFETLVRNSSDKPKFGSLNGLVHQKIASLILHGLAEHGLSTCDPNHPTVAVMADGAVQFTGYCTTRPAAGYAVHAGSPSS
jgi:hypothetical protein